MRVSNLLTRLQALLYEHVRSKYGDGQGENKKEVDAFAKEAPVLLSLVVTLVQKFTLFVSVSTNQSIIRIFGRCWYKNDVKRI